MRAGAQGGLSGEPGPAVSLTLFRFPTAYHKHWALWRMLLARPALRRMPGVRFLRMVGAGSAEGFRPWPDFGVYGVIAAWPSIENARDQIAGAAPFRRYREHASESVTFHLRATRCRGAWGGRAPFAVEGADRSDAPLAVLTRAAIRPTKAVAFWSRTPAIRAAIPKGPGLLFQAGLGELPWLNQITFSVWTDRAALDEFARSGPHGRAAIEARRRRWFAEELFARFEIVAAEGVWRGRAPLAQSSEAA